MDKQHNELFKSYFRSRNEAYKAGDSLSKTELLFDMKHGNKFFEYEKGKPNNGRIVNMVARNPTLADVFDEKIKKMEDIYLKVMFNNQPDLLNKYSERAKDLNFHSLLEILKRQPQTIKWFGEHGRFDYVSMKQMVDILVEMPEQYDELKKYFNMKYIEGSLLFDLLNEIPELFDKEELNVNTIKPEEFVHLGKFYPNIKNSDKFKNYKYEHPTFLQ